MGLFTYALNRGSNKVLDHVVHFCVFLAIAILNVVLLNEHPDSRIITALSAVALGTSATSTLYHAGVGLSLFCNHFEDKEKGEMESGKALRNLLTALTLVFVGVALGVKQKLLNINLPDANDQGNADNKQMNSLWWQFLLLLLARLSDVFFDLVDRDLYDVAHIQCDKKEEESICDVFNARIILTHVLLISSTIMTGMLVDGDYKLMGLDDTESTWLTITLVLVIVHTGLYPLVYLLHYLFFDEETGKIVLPFIGDSCLWCGKRKDDCDGKGWDRVRSYVITGARSTQYTLESLNRIPIIRTLVSSTILAVLSLLVGHTLQNARAQLIVIDLVLYIAVDALGRNVV